MTGRQELTVLWAWRGYLTEAWVEQDDRIIAKLTLTASSPPVILFPEGDYYRLPEKGQVKVRVWVNVEKLQVLDQVPPDLLPPEAGGYLRFGLPGIGLPSLTVGIRQDFLVIRPGPEPKGPALALASKAIRNLPMTWFKTIGYETLNALGGDEPRSWGWLLEERGRQEFERFVFRALTGQVPPVLVSPADVAGEVADLFRDMIDRIALGGAR